MATRRANTPSWPCSRSITALPEIVTNQKQARWKQLYSTSIAGKTLLIVGVGSVGGNTAKFAKQFGLRVLGVRRTGKVTSSRR